jgi:hypothetical protein
MSGSTHRPERYRGSFRTSDGTRAQIATAYKAGIDTGYRVPAVSVSATTLRTKEHVATYQRCGATLLDARVRDGVSRPPDMRYTPLKSNT